MASKRNSQAFNEGIKDGQKDKAYGKRREFLEEQYNPSYLLGYEQGFNCKILVIDST